MNHTETTSVRVDLSTPFTFNEATQYNAACQYALKLTKIIGWAIFIIATLAVLNFPIGPSATDIQKNLILILTGILLGIFKETFINRFIPSLIVKKINGLNIEKPFLYVFQDSKKSKNMMNKINNASDNLHQEKAYIAQIKGRNLLLVEYLELGKRII